MVYFWRVKEEDNGYRALNGSLLTVNCSVAFQVINTFMTGRSNIKATVVSQERNSCNMLAPTITRNLAACLIS